MSCHAALSIKEFLAKHSITVVPHPPHPPDLAPRDFFLFPRLKGTLKGKRFQDGDTTKYDTAVAGHSQAYETCTEKWNDRWNRCIQSAGSYFEGDNFE
jgi:hypothetical protein